MFTGEHGPFFVLFMAWSLQIGNGAGSQFDYIAITPAPWGSGQQIHCESSYGNYDRSPCGQSFDS